MPNVISGDSDLSWLDELEPATRAITGPFANRAKQLVALARYGAVTKAKRARYTLPAEPLPE
jgi:hypothetical protein